MPKHVLRRITASDISGCVAVLRDHDPSQEAQEWTARLGRDVADGDKRPVVAVVGNLVVGYARTLPFHHDAESPPDAAPDGYYLLGLVVALALIAGAESGGCQLRNGCDGWPSEVAPAPTTTQAATTSRHRNCMSRRAFAA